MDMKLSSDESDSVQQWVTWDEAFGRLQPTLEWETPFPRRCMLSQLVNRDPSEKAQHAGFVRCLCCRATEWPDLGDLAQRVAMRPRYSAPWTVDASGGVAAWEERFELSGNGVLQEVVFTPIGKLLLSSPVYSKSITYQLSIPEAHAVYMTIKYGVGWRTEGQATDLATAVSCVVHVVNTVRVSSKSSPCSQMPSSGLLSASNHLATHHKRIIMQIDSDGLLLMSSEAR
ncbi:hypothetical protein LZ30DRAFT_92830 [Colletotrichum cereale]|nr:hypothetical protein LZ30DRAFT_92830 [Colletotrichum cereale]